ncbi:MAG: SixA phosphatase family protein [Akkermansiaceae bacterium]
MNLLLIRHATADAHGLPGGDFPRALIEKGQDQARRVGKFLSRYELIPDLVLSSPVIRAKETAEILAEEGCPAPTIEEWLACGMPPETALQELTAYARFKSVAIVGHEPDFSALVEHLLGANHYTVRVKKASVISIKVAPPRAKGILDFLIPCRFLGAAQEDS